MWFIAMVVLIIFGNFVVMIILQTLSNGLGWDVLEHYSKRNTHTYMLELIVYMSLIWQYKAHYIDCDNYGDYIVFLKVEQRY